MSNVHAYGEHEPSLVMAPTPRPVVWPQHPTPIRSRHPCKYEPSQIDAVRTFGAGLLEVHPTQLQY
eukprot:717252-Prymnesium_polylepis.1